MSPRIIQEHLRKKPFQPFRVFISDGSSYEVRHPELAYIGARELIVAIRLDLDDVPLESAYLDPLHVTRIEPLNGDDGPRRASAS